MNEADDDIEGLGFDFAENIKRLQRQKRARIKVIVMNPPYSAGQDSANDNNQNLKYPRLDGRIEETYARHSTASTKIKLYDSYFRALRWASDRIGNKGIIAFVSNNSFLDANTTDGFRLTFQNEFSDIYIYNLKGNQRTQGDRSRREGGEIFDSGSRTGITIAVFVKTAGHAGEARIYYTEVDDYLTRQEKLDEVAASRSIATTSFGLVKPNSHGDWISQRDETFSTFQALGDKATKGNASTNAMLRQYSLGLNTNRDAWCWSFGSERVAENVSRMIRNYNRQFQTGSMVRDPAQIAWSSSLDSLYRRSVGLSFDRSRIRNGIYRPFVKEQVYFDRKLNHRTGQLPQLFPSPVQPNLAITVPTDTRREWSTLMADRVFDLTFTPACQGFPLYTWEKIPDAEPDELSLWGAAENAADDDTDAHEDTANLTFDFSKPIGDQVPSFIDGYQRRDNITDATLATYRANYGDEGSPSGEQITKEDIFFYVYALLHHPDYRERYEADLKKMLPRIPMVPGFWEFSDIGRDLADLHVNYEKVEQYPITESWALDAPTDEWDKYRVEKLAWGKTGRNRDTSKLVYNDYLTFTDIPAGINDYQVGGRSPLEWMIDRYKVTVDKKSQIRNDPNDYFREVDNPRYLADLIKSLVTVTVRTQELVNSLPELVIEEVAE